MNSTVSELARPGAAPAVAVRSLRVRRGNRDVLPDLSLDVRAGVVTALLGPSGCGKSTLMRAIVGVQIVHGGAISVLGQPAGSPGLRRRVGYVTQAPSVYPDLTVRQNLAYFSRVLDVDPSRVDEVVGVVGLETQVDQLVGTLSGGERSRASLAVALLARPELLVLDEPTVGLDPLLRQSLWALFRELVRGGITVLLSTHVMDEADRCDELVLMSRGRVIATGAPAGIVAEAGTPNLEAAFIQLSGAQR